jgi:SAM-dependent methyltransferase
MFSIDHLNRLRRAEIEFLVSHLFKGARILEIGAGTGQQASDLAARGFDVVAIEKYDSRYASDRLFPIVDYDGRNIPFDSNSFDIVFSSNVLEHVEDLAQINKEIRRVLRPGGYAVHIMPTHSWRFWTTLSALPTAFQYVWSLRTEIVPRRLFSTAEAYRLAGAWVRVARHLVAPLAQRRHGERGNIISELWLFRPNWWRKAFRENGFEIVSDEPMGLFYTGHMVFGQNWSLKKRASVAPWLGSACHLFRVRPISSESCP